MFAKSVLSVFVIVVSPVTKSDKAKKTLYTYIVFKTNTYRVHIVYSQLKLD